MKVCYLVDGDELEFETIWDKEKVEWIAQDAAKHFHEYHDGVESDWPLDFEIYIDDESCGTFKVEREWRPEFSATQLDI